MKIDTNIKFTPMEQEAIFIIKEVINKYAPDTQVFIVGGLIRDRLVGLPSNDLDIMVYPIKAEDFARLITKHLNIKDPHIIKDNPDKSKFISTSKIYLPTRNGIQEIDIAQARQDVYREKSRIPETQLATPEQDAMRRDFTINSIMFDIKNNKIVDFTGKGIQDLVSNTIRTPLNPLKTFSDDPLRIFRAIVYASKLNAKIDPETYQAMMNPELRNEIKQKISKERIGQEFIKMLKNPNPTVAIELLKNTGLLQDIMAEALKGSKYEGKIADLDMSQDNPHHKLTLWGHTMQVIKGVVEKYQDAEPETRITMILAALMHDLGKLYKDIWGESKKFPGNRSYHGHEDESQEIAGHILKYLKMEPLIKSVSLLAQKHMIPHRFTEQNSGGMKALRKFIRQCGEESVDWIDVFNLSVADAYAKDIIRDPSIVNQYSQLEARLREALATLKPIADKPDIKPVLNGNEIMEALNFRDRGIKPGAIMKELTEFVKELRDENPDISKEEAIQLLRTKYESSLPPIKMAQQETKEDKKESKEQIPEEKDTTCPMQLLKNKIQEINNLFRNNKLYEVMSICDQLEKEYGEDENITRLIAVSVFGVLSRDQQHRNNDLLSYLFQKASENFFDCILCSYVLGLILLLDTATEDDIITDMGNRVTTMSPDLVIKIFKKLPQEIFHNKLKKSLEKML